MPIGPTSGFLDFTNATPRANVIVALSNIGIGTDVPLHAFDLRGTANVADIIINNDLTLTGGLTTNSLTINSMSMSTTSNFQQVTNVGNVTTNTVEFANPTTGLAVTSNAEVGGELSVSGDVEMSSNLTVSGDATVSGNVEMSSNLTVSGNVGIGTNNPQGGLHVYQKTLVLGELSSNPSSSPNGSMYYNTSLKDVVIKIDDSWRILESFTGPTLISGLVGWYLPENWTGSQWTDASAAGNHTTSTTGTINYNATHDGTNVGAQSTFPVLYGDTSATITFPTTILPSTYTIIYMTRYNGSNKKRILDGENLNWLSGHWNGYAGVAYHSGFLMTAYDRHGSNWVLGTDQNNLYRSKSEGIAWEENTGGGTEGVGTTYARLRINNDAAEVSDWMCGEIIVYNRKLSSEEYNRLENYMQNKYKIY
jgi:cytoskeletal protein CcmA (bactofilin family)